MEKRALPWHGEDHHSTHHDRKNASQQRRRRCSGTNNQDVISREKLTTDTPSIRGRRSISATGTVHRQRSTGSLLNRNGTKGVGDSKTPAERVRGLHQAHLGRMSTWRFPRAISVLSMQDRGDEHFTLADDGGSWAYCGWAGRRSMAGALKFRRKEPPRRCPGEYRTCGSGTAFELAAVGGSSPPWAGIIVFPPCITGSERSWHTGSFWKASLRLCHRTGPPRRLRLANHFTPGVVAWSTSALRAGTDCHAYPAPTAARHQHGPSLLAYHFVAPVRCAIASTIARPWWLPPPSADYAGVPTGGYRGAHPHEAQVWTSCSVN